MPKKIKSSQFKLQSRLIRTPPTSEINYDNHTPIFSFRYLEENHSISKCQKEEKISFVDKMEKISQCTWRELILSSKHGLGSEKISRESLNVSIPTKITPDVTFIAFRFYDKAPMVGFRDKDIFHIVWFDREFKIYKH